MQSILENLLHNKISIWLLIPIVFCVAYTALFIGKKILLHTVKRFVRKTTTQLDDILLKAANMPLNLLAVIFSFGIIYPMIPIPAEDKFHQYFGMGFKGSIIIAIIVFVDAMADGLIQFYSGRIEILKSSSILVRGASRIIIAGLGLLVILDSFGVSITPIIASLGIGSLAVALAVKSTLENFVCGMQLITDQPIMVGHFVKLESGEEGYVEKIGWRSTWLREPNNNIIVIPNSSLINSRITNYYYPNREVVVKIEVGVHYDSDLNHVERVAVDVAKKVLKECKGAVSGFEPAVRFHTLDSSSINFTVVLRALEHGEGGNVKHEFIKKLHERFKQEGITMPYPIRAINFTQEKSLPEQSGQLKPAAEDWASVRQNKGI
jgi:small-conductance mechanosensitive channel